MCTFCRVFPEELVGDDHEGEWEPQSTAPVPAALVPGGSGDRQPDEGHALQPGHRSSVQWTQSQRMDFK